MEYRPRRKPTTIYNAFYSNTVYTILQTLSLFSLFLLSWSRVSGMPCVGHSIRASDVISLGVLVNVYVGYGFMTFVNTFN